MSPIDEQGLRSSFVDPAALVTPRIGFVEWMRRCHYMSRKDKRGGPGFRLAHLGVMTTF